MFFEILSLFQKNNKSIEVFILHGQHPKMCYLIKKYYFILFTSFREIRFSISYYIYGSKVRKVLEYVFSNIGPMSKNN